MDFEEEGFKSEDEIPGAVYVIRHKKTDSFYVGSTSDVHRRMTQHRYNLSRNAHPNKNLQDLFNESPDVEIFYKASANRAVAFIEEQQYVDKLKETGRLLNVAVDDVTRCVGIKKTPEQRKNMSDGAIGRKMPPVSDEQRKQRSERLKGKPLSEEHKAKISASSLGKPKGPHHHDCHRGVPKSEETKAKLSQAKLGKPLSEEHKAKIAAAGIGRQPTAETRAKLSASVAKSWEKRREKAASEQ